MYVGSILPLSRIRNTVEKLGATISSQVHDFWCSGTIPYTMNTFEVLLLRLILHFTGGMLRDSIDKMTVLQHVCSLPHSYATPFPSMVKPTLSYQYTFLLLGSLLMCTKINISHI